MHAHTHNACICCVHECTQAIATEITEAHPAVMIATDKAGSNVKYALTRCIKPVYADTLIRAKKLAGALAGLRLKQ